MPPLDWVRGNYVLKIYNAFFCHMSSRIHNWPVEYLLGTFPSSGLPDFIALPFTAPDRETYSAVKGAARQDLDYAAVMQFWKK